MNHLPNEHDDQQRRLDLLVDGELTQTDRRELIASLDEQTDGWRRCALAFLEAQSWGDDLAAIAHPAPASPIAAPRATVALRSWWQAPGPSMLMALAASVLLVFGLGLGAGRWLPRPGTGDATASGFGEATLASSRAGRTVAEFQPAQSQADNQPGSDADHVTVLLAEGNDDVVPVQVPVVGDPASAAGWFNSLPPLPPDVRRALERHGSRVRENRQLIPVRMGDGRQVVVPVDRIDLQPVNLKDYQ